MSSLSLLTGGVLLVHNESLNELEEDALLHGHRNLSLDRLWANLQIGAGPELETGKGKTG